MAKKKFGKFVALATVSGVIAAGISYFLKYKSFNNELDEDFHDFEGDDDEFDGELPHASETGRTYVTLSEKKDEMADTVKDAAKEVIGKATEVVYDAEDAVTDAVSVTADDVVQKVQDTAEKAFEKAEDTAEDAKDMSDMVKSAVTETAEAVKHAVESTMSTTIEDDDM